MPLGKQRNFHFLFLRSFPFRIKFWIAWFLSRGSNEELEMMLQNAVLPRCNLPPARSLWRSRGRFLLLPVALFASPKASRVFSQLSSLLVAQRNASWKRGKLCRPWYIWRGTGLAIIQNVLWITVRYCNCIIGEMKPGQEIEDKLLFCVSSFKCTTAFIIYNM